VALGRTMHELQRDTSTYLENAAGKYRHLYFSPEFLGFFSKTFGSTVDMIFLEYPTVLFLSSSSSG